MKIQSTKSLRAIFVPALTLIGFCAAQFAALAQGTAFTYQGRLSDAGSPANGRYDLRFILYGAEIGGNQQGPILTTNGVAASNGLFTVTLDFGANFPGADRWLEIAVRTNAAASFVTLTPRQKLTPAPYAITAGNVASGGLTAGTYSNAVTFNNPANSFSGSGAGLITLNASSLANGTVPDARLSGNVALLNRNQAFTGTNLFPGIGVGVGSLSAPLQVVQFGASGLSDSFDPSIWGDSAGGDGIFGSTAAPQGFGVYGYASGTNGTGIYGYASNTNGFGVVGVSDAIGGVGVYGFDGTGSGQSDQFTPSLWGDSGTGDGIFGSTSASGGYGIYGYSGGDSGIGIYGETSATNGAGVYAVGASSNSPALTIGLGGFQVAGAGANTGTAAFIQVVNASNISPPPSTSTVINNPLCNGDPNAILIVTPRAPGTYAHAVNVSYAPNAGNRWLIYNADGAVMNIGDAFDVLIIKP